MNRTVDADDRRTLVAELGFDPDALRNKYREERDKRFNSERNAQWTPVSGNFSDYADDPYVDQPLRRAPVAEQIDVLIVGGGFGGLISAANLRRQGIDSFRIIEKAGDFGGTWYWNRYPGAQCDIESYIYLPLLEETGYIPTEKYAHAQEILDHARRIGRHFDLYPAALFQTEIKEMRWQEERQRWLVTTDRGDKLHARFVISASGPLNRPKLPGIPGIDSFKGHSFHTSRWDYAYTGGHSRGGMTKLADKRVAVIGTGATAVQCIPYVGQDAGHLYVFQRTPSNVDVRGNHPTDPTWAAGLKPGWQAHRTQNFNILVSGALADEDLVNDGWTDMMRDLISSLLPKAEAEVSPAELLRLKELADFRKGNRLRDRIAAIVKNPGTAEKLKAWYPMFCKRPTFNDEYLPAFNRPNVTLVDTEGRGVERITPGGLVVGGREYPADCIIFATGFETGTAYTKRSGFEVHGRGGETLSEHYAHGLRTLHGFYSHGFPNFFILGLSQNAFKPNIVDMLTEQSAHITALITHVHSRGLNTVEPTAQAETDWLRVIQEKSAEARAFLAECTPGYYSGEGDVDKGLLVDSYGGGSLEFSRLLSDWQGTGRMEGLRFS